MRIGALVALLAFVSVVLSQYEGINTGEGLQSLLFPGNGGIELATTQGRATLAQSLPVSFTFESWVMLPNPPADGFYKTIVSHYDIGLGRNAHNRYADFDLQVQASGTLNVFFGNGGPSDYGFLVFGNQLVQGRWTHVAFSVSQTDPNAPRPDICRLYYDDTQWNKSWTSGTRNFYPQRSIFLGDYFNQDGDHKYWLGYMDEVRFWSGVRSDSQLSGLKQRVVPSDAAGLLAYYRFNDGAGLYLQDSSPNRFDGMLYKVTASTTSPLWRVSGAKIHVDVMVAPGSITTLYLPGFSPSGAFTFTYAIESLPVTTGTLNGTGRLLADQQIITTTPFALISNQIAFQAPDQLTGIQAAFTYYGTTDLTNPAAREPTSTSVFVQIGPVVCQRDACGQCNGDNSTCSCLPLPYNGLNLNDVQRMLLLYEIQQTLALLDEVQAKIEATLTILSAHQVAELQTIINEVQLFGSSCLLAFCSNIQGYLDTLAAIGPN